MRVVRHAGTIGHTHTQLRRDSFRDAIGCLIWGAMCDAASRKLICAWVWLHCVVGVFFFFLERCEWEKRSIVKCAFSVECYTRISSFGEVFYADVKYVDACGSLNMKIFNLNDNKRS